MKREKYPKYSEWDYSDRTPQKAWANYSMNLRRRTKLMKWKVRVMRVDSRMRNS